MTIPANLPFTSKERDILQKGTYLLRVQMAVLYLIGPA